MKLLVIGLAAWASALGQTSIDAGHLAAVRNSFDSAARAAHLRCQARPVRPALTYGLQFQTGYVVDVPLNQFNGGGHGLSVLLRVTPEGREPVYFGNSGTVPVAAAVKTDAELPGSIVVGEGSYGVEVLVEDDAARVCYSKWRVEAKATGNERDLKPTLRAGEVQELGTAGAAVAQNRGTQQIDRLTILVHAAATNPQAAAMNPETIRALADSVSSLLVQLPARSVHLVVFNLDKQVVLLNKEPFVAKDLEELTRSIEQLQLAVVDYKTLQNRERADVLSDLIVRELRNPRPASAVILMGPRTTSQTDASLEAALPRSGAVPWFYLQYMAGRPSQRVYGPEGVDASTKYDLGRRTPAILAEAASAPATFSQAMDGIERLIRKLNGVTLAVRTPHEFADAIHRMSSGIPTVNVPGGTQAPEPVAARPSILSGDNDPVEVLARLRNRVVERAGSVPNHTCVESVRRDTYEPYAGRSAKSCDSLLAARKQAGDRLRLDLTDWLRLDVGMADGHEIFSWAGAARFEEGDIDEVITEGAFGSGPFATMMLSIFENRNPHFVFDGETTLDGRRLLGYSFQVPREESHYRVKAHHEWIVTGFSGTLMVDPQTSDLVRFVVRTEELPEATETCEVDTTLDYSLTPIGGFEYLLPKSTRQRFIGRDGAENENSVTFASCREFTGESTLTFGKRPAGAEYFVHAPPESALPAGMPLAIELTSPIAFGKAAKGDRIEGRLAAALRDAGTQRQIAPAGARVLGRLDRVELRHSGSGEYTVALRWEALETGSETVPLNLKPNRQPVSPRPVARSVLQQRGMAIELPQPGEEQDAVYHFSGQRAGVESGLRTEWVTAAR